MLNSQIHLSTKLKGQPKSMQSQDTEPTVIDSAQVQQLHADLSKEIYNSLAQVNVVNLLEKYGFSNDDSFELQFLIDLSKVNSNGESESHPHQGVLPSITPPKVKLQGYYYNGQYYSCGYP
ncbi:hypothetical protein [Nostoc piscinale]|uniref:hypothetical protein n=1 Tax=Nostoc piscinale TaxID=224012 RepID=UPI0039A49E44